MRWSIGVVHHGRVLGMWIRPRHLVLHVVIVPLWRWLRVEMLRHVRLMVTMVLLDIGQLGWRNIVGHLMLPPTGIYGLPVSVIHIDG